MYARIDRVAGGQLFFVTGPPFLRTNVPLGPVVQMAQVKGSRLTSLQGGPAHLTTTGRPTNLLISPFFGTPIKLAVCVCGVDGQNMLMSFPQRIFAKCGNSYLDRQQLDIMGSWNKQAISSLPN